MPRCLAWPLAVLMLVAVSVPGQDDEPADPLAAARSAKAAGQLQTTRNECRKVLAAAPDNPEAWWLLAWAEAGLHNREAALVAFQKAAQNLSTTDPRYEQARRKAAQLRAELRPLPPARPPAVPGPPPEARVSFWASWPARILALVLAICATVTGRTALADRNAARRLPAARFADLCLRARRGQAVGIDELFALADGDHLRSLPDHDLALAVNLAAGLGDQARADLARMVREGDGRRRGIAAQALARQAAQPDPTVWRPLLDADETALRRAALLALQQTPDPGAVDPLRRLATGDDVALAPQAAAALAAVRGDRAAEALASVAAEAELPAVRRQALAALAGRRSLPESIVRPLTPLLKLDDETRLLAVACFSIVGERARRRLLAGTLDASETVRAAALNALLHNPHGHFAQPPPEWAAPLRRHLAHERASLTPEGLRLVLAWDPAGAQPVVERALRSGGEIRRLAVEHLAGCGGPEADELLARALSAVPAADLDADERDHLSHLAEAAARRGLVSALPGLIARLAAEPDDPGLQGACTVLAGASGAGAALAVACADPRPSVRAVAIGILSRHPLPEAADALLAELERAGQGAVAWPTVLQAAGVLCELGDRRALRLLQSLRDRHAEARGDALDISLARLGDPESQRRVDAMLVRPTWAGRRPAAAYFDGLRELPPRAAAVVREAAAHRAAEALELDLPDAADRLAALGQDVLPTLEEWLEQPDRRALAEAAMERLRG